MQLASDRHSRHAEIQKLRIEAATVERELQNTLVVVATRARERGLTSPELQPVWDRLSALEGAKATNDGLFAQGSVQEQQAIAGLQVQLQQVQGRIAQLQQDIGRMRQSAAALQAQKNSIPPTVEGAQLHVQLASQIGTLQAELSRAEAEFRSAEQMRVQLGNEQAARMARLQSATASVAGGAAGYERQRRELHEQAGRLVTQAPQLATAVGDLGQAARNQLIMLDQVRATIAGYEADIEGYAGAATSILGLVVTLVLLGLSFLIAVGSIEENTLSEAGWAVLAAACFMFAVPIRTVGSSFARLGAWVVTAIAVGVCVGQRDARIAAAIILFLGGGALLFWRPARRASTPLALIFGVVALIGGGFGLEYRDTWRDFRRRSDEAENRLRREERIAVTRQDWPGQLSRAEQLIDNGKLSEASSLISSLSEAAADATDRGIIDGLKQKLRSAEEAEERAREQRAQLAGARAGACAQRCLAQARALFQQCSQMYGADACQSYVSMGLRCSENCVTDPNTYR
jgi:chromosome segregation ATPase